MEKLVRLTKNSSIKNFHYEKPQPNVFYYLMILNTPLNKNLIDVFLQLNPYIVCGDGGSNRFFDVLENSKNRTTFLPNLITGDFDSIKPEIKKYYESLGVTCLHDPCQNTTDMDKSMKCVITKVEENAKTSPKSEHKIIITGCLGSRFDHNLSNMSNILKYTTTLQSKEFIDSFTLQIIHDQSLMTCILPGKSFYYRSKILEKQEDFGLFPLSGPCKNIETKGLKWNLGGEFSSLVFGQFVSSSNLIVDDVVEIDVSDPIFLIASLQDKFG